MAPERSEGIQDLSSLMDDLVIEKIDEDGDVLVRTDSKKLLVSSKVLGLASPVFKVILDSDFKEARVARSSRNPLELSLLDDNPDGLTALFQAWHFSRKGDYLQLSIDTMVELSLLADKYDCTLSVQSIGENWLNASYKTGQSVPDLWKSCTIAYLLKNASRFSDFTLKLVELLSEKELSGSMLHEALPHAIGDNLLRLRARIVHDMAAEVQKAADKIIHDTVVHETENKACARCSLPVAQYSRIRVCQNSKNHVFNEVICNAQSRVYEFLSVLGKAKLWPFTVSFKTSPVEFQSRVAAIKSNLDHVCQGGHLCPLFQQSEALQAAISSVMKSSKGLNLQSFGRGIL